MAQQKVVKVDRRSQSTTSTTVIVKLLTESGDSAGRISPDTSPRLTDEGVALYNKYLAPAPPEHSQFLKDVKKLIDYYQPFYLSNTPPNIWPDLFDAKEAWRRKKGQLTELSIQYNVASVTCEDAPLLHYCREIAGTTESLALYFFRWNFLSDCKDLLTRYMFNPELTMNLLPFRDDKNTLQLKYLSIKCQFVLVKRRMTELNDELRASTNYHAVQARIAGYLQDLTEKQKEINRLKAKEEAAEKCVAVPPKLLESKGIDEDSEELVKLRARCEQLEQLLDEANDEKKLLGDENRLLKEKLSLHDEEGEVVRRQSPELESDAPEDLQSEVARLRAELQQAREELARKETELEELRDHSRIDRTHDSADENCVIAFSQAAQHGNSLYWKSQRLIKELKGEQFRISDTTPPVSQAPTSKC